MPIDRRHILHQRGTFEKSTQSRSAGGDTVDSWKVVEPSVPMLLRFAKSVSDIPPGISSTITHVIYTEPYAPLRSGKWRITLLGVEYLVVSAIDQGGKGEIWKNLVRRESL